MQFKLDFGNSRNEGLLEGREERSAGKVVGLLHVEGGDEEDFWFSEKKNLA